MKVKVSLIGIVIFIFFATCNFAQPDDFPVLEGPYLGQKQPGMTPQLFAEGIISGKGHTHGSPAVSPDLKTIYWDEQENEGSHRKIYYSRLLDNRWTQPQFVPFTEAWDGDTPVLSPDGQTLFFNSRRPLKDNPDLDRERIWFVTISADNDFSDPQPVSEAINGDALHWQISIDRAGNFYFGSEREGSLGLDDIFYAALENGEYVKVENVGRPINSENHESTPFIDPDGRYLLFVRRLDIFISCKQENGSWGAPVNLSEKYPDFYGTCPRVTPDGKYIFINRYENRRANVYWVDAEIIERFQPGATYK